MHVNPVHSKTVQAHVMATPMQCYRPYQVVKTDRSTDPATADFERSPSEQKLLPWGGPPA